MSVRLRAEAAFVRLERAIGSLCGLFNVVGTAALVAMAWSPTILADPATAQPEFTASQASAGGILYTEKCAGCHGGALEGRGGPALSGPQFTGKWVGSHTIGELLYVLHQMPLDAPGSLTEAQYTQLGAFIFLRNGYRPGPVELGASTESKGILSLTDTTATPLRAQSNATLQLPQAPEKVASASARVPDDRDLKKPDEANWLMYNKSFSGQRYSALDQINRRNAKDLAPVCLFQAGEVGAFQTSPVVFRGVMYVTTKFTTFAMDAATCEKRWENVYPSEKAAGMPVNRGIALYQGKVFRATPDGHLLALEAHSGALLWDAQIADSALGYWLTMAPIAYDGRVFIGTAGSEMGSNGRIHALDAQTGQALWTFNVIPVADEPGARTWEKGAAHGGGSVWSTFSLQPDEGLLLAPAGNPAPDYDGAARPGDNLYTDSVVALDYRTGKLAWYVQQISHDIHDWDTAAAPVTYEVDGRHYMAVASKAGWLYIYDRDTRELVSRSEVSPHLNAEVPLGREAVHYCPGNNGGVAWNGPAFTPRLRRLFVNSIHWCGTTLLAEYHYAPGEDYRGGLHTFDPASLARGFTRAVDAATGKEIWVRESSSPMYAGVTVTAGDVLLTGQFDGSFVVLDAVSGKGLYAFNTGGGLAGGVSTYLVGHRQYIAVVSGNESAGTPPLDGAATIVVFALQK
jgi:alcohol dehydrogenase (cytochrome c)